MEYTEPLGPMRSYNGGCLGGTLKPTSCRLNIFRAFALETKFKLSLMKIALAWSTSHRTPLVSENLGAAYDEYSLLLTTPWEAASSRLIERTFSYPVMHTVLLLTLHWEAAFGPLS